MNLNDYQELAARTRGNISVEHHILNCALGIVGEGGEIADHIKKWAFQGHKLEDPEILKELGDVLWYVAEMASMFGYSLSEVAEGNILKLKTRYPSGFSEEKSVNRVE